MHEAWPSANHMASPDLAVRQHQLRSAVKPNLQPKSLARRDRNRFRSLQGRVTTATPIPRVLDFMLGLMTSRHEGCVSTMLTESGLSIALPVRHFKGLCDEYQGARRQAPSLEGAFRLDSPRGRVKLQRRVTRRSTRAATRWSVLICMPFGRGFIGFGVRPSREGPVALQRGLPDHFRTLATDALKELALGLLVPGLNPPCSVSC